MMHIQRKTGGRLEAVDLFYSVFKLFAFQRRNQLVPSTRKREFLLQFFQDGQESIQLPRSLKGVNCTEAQIIVQSVLFLQKIDQPFKYGIEALQLLDDSVGLLR